MGRIWHTEQQLLKQLTPLLNSKINLPHLRLRECWKARQQLKILWQGEPSKSQDELQWCKQQSFLRTKSDTTKQGVIKTGWNPSDYKITKSQIQRQRHLCSTELTFLLLPLWLLSRSIFSFSPSFCVLFSSFWSWSPLSSSFNLNGKAKQQYPMIELILVYLTYSCLSKATKSDEPPCNQQEVTQVTSNEVPIKEGKETERQPGGLSKNENAHQLICEFQKAPCSSFLKVCTKKQEVNSVRSCFLCQK